MNTRIKEIRLENNLTQEQFGLIIGVARNTVANYENGKRTPSNAIILSICRAFNINESWLRTGIGNKYIQLDQNEKIVAWISKLTTAGTEYEFAKKFVYALSELNLEQWLILEEIAKKMASTTK